MILEKRTLKQHKESRERLERESRSIIILKNLFILNRKKLSKINDNLMKIVANEDLLFSAYEKLKKNRGATTPGTKQETADEMTLEKIKKLSQDLVNGRFQWSPIKKVMIPKPGKTEERPLGIPNFQDRLVQENIRIILEVIYEPIFQRYELNHGFRPRRSCETALIKLQRESKELTWAIEGDIKAAYPSVNHKIMLKILKEKINDRKFLSLIKDGLQHNIVFKETTAKNLLGTPQGGIASPILFNIYMHKFDMFIKDVINKKIRSLNTAEQRKASPSLPETYRKKKKEIELSKNEIVKLKAKEGPLNRKEKRTIIESRDIMRNNKKEILQIRSQRANKLLIRSFYIRYADDWIFLTNGRKEFCIEIKEQISNWLKDHLKLQLDENKTNITDLTRNKAKFLGFTIFHKKKRIIKKLMSNGAIIRQRSTVPLTIGIDHERVRNRLQHGSIINENLEPRSNLLYLQLNPVKMIIKYRQRLEGLINYYHNVITYENELNFYYYAYKFSCLKTLARRRKQSMKSITLRHGHELKFEIEVVEKTPQGKRKRIIKAEFPSYKKTFDRAREMTEAKHIELYRKIKKSKLLGTKNIFNNPNYRDCFNNQNIVNDPFSMRDISINLRSQYQLKTHCCVCGHIGTKDEPIEIHHTKHVKKGKSEGFKQIMKILNRKSIPVCRECHLNIHKGIYDGKTLNDLFDMELILV